MTDPYPAILEMPTFINMILPVANSDM